MKKCCFLRNTHGTSILELVIALFICSILVTGIFRVARAVFASANREKQKAEMLRSIMSVSNIIERDIRMAGCGLPGNGMRAILNDGYNDYLMIFTNENRIQTVLTKPVGVSDIDLPVKDTVGFTPDKWVCVESVGKDTIYREISAVTTKNGDKVITLTTPVGVVASILAGSNVYAATRISYMVVNSPKPALQRKRNDLTIDLGVKLQKISVIPKNAAGTVVAFARDADVLTVVLGGYVGMGANMVLLADSTEVNIRN
jgi:hypothetical protein